MQQLRIAAYAFARISHKYDQSLEGNTDTSGTMTRDQDVPIGDMGEKSKIWERIETQLLPSIREQITSLATSLNLQASEELPNPNLELALVILSKLDLNLENALSLTQSFALGSPVPDERHDHHLKKWKSFRCFRLTASIEGLIHISIRTLLQYCAEFLQWCNLPIAERVDPSAQQEACKLRQRIHFYTSDAGDCIEDTIQWSRKSDWAIIHKNWIGIADSFSKALQDLNVLTKPTIDPASDLANLTINPTEEHDRANIANTHARTQEMRKRLIEVMISTIPLAKLGRISVKKALKMIPKQPMYKLDTELN
ncbi:hypothetical protein PSHT_10826 [Puccinia striiformis]|nr:hypothetical protein PSHT_10826 [Puccinia striiformis]